MNVAKNLKSAKQPFKKIFAHAHARFVNFPENLAPKNLGIFNGIYTKKGVIYIKSYVE